MGKGTCSTDGCERGSSVRGKCGACYQQERRKRQRGPCSISECDAPQYAVELCAKHYSRFQRHGTTDGPDTGQLKLCGIEGCESKSRARGWCNLHYRRWVLTGDPLKTKCADRKDALRIAVSKTCTRCKLELPLEDFPVRKEMLDGRHSHCLACGKLDTKESADRKRERMLQIRGPKPPPAECSVDGCHRRAISRGWCKGHYEKWRRTDDVNPVLRDISPKRTEDELAAEEKPCSKCKKILPIDVFHDRIDAPDGKSYVCRQCVRVRNAKVQKRYAEDQDFRDKRSEYHRKYRQKYREDMKERQRATKLWTNYGMTLDEYEEIYRTQDGVCAICGSGPHGGPEWARKQWLSVDHCHTTGHIRGLLCDNCNIGLGKFKDDPEFLQVAIEYLTRSTGASS